MFYPLNYRHPQGVGRCFDPLPLPFLPAVEGVMYEQTAGFEVASGEARAERAGLMQRLSVAYWDAVYVVHV